MINLEKIAEELFNKIRGRYPSITIGDETSTITNVPPKARFFDFDFKEGVKVNITLDEKSITILYNNDLIEGSSDTVKSNWFNFMKEMRTFAKRRMLNFDTRDITKTNLDKRDYQYLSQNRPGEETMSESKMYGTSKTSFQDIGNAKMIVKHRGPVDFENPAGRTQKIDSIYIESAEGERFKYPFRHLNGARAMATHVSEGGNQYDSFGKHIVSLSEELSKLRTFKTYMNRSAVMAEGLAGYMDIVNTRIDTIKETVFKLQRPTHYKEAFESFEETVMEEVPEDVSSNWIDELTIRQFNEELKSVFPYIYNLVKENTKPTEIGPEDLLGEFDGPDETEDGGKKEQLKAWYDKYSKYEGMNGDALPQGMFIGWTDSGILTDGVEGNELEKAIDKLGGNRDEAEEKLFNDEKLFSKLLPITDAMQEEFKKIMGGLDEDKCREANKILGEETTGFSLEGMNMEEADDGKKEQLQAWYEKYNKYDPADIGSLADGMFKFFQDSGVDLDTVEKSEYDALVAKHGEDKVEGNALRFLSDEDTPITKAMFDEFERIMGEPADEESSEKAVSLLGLDEGMNMEDAYASHLDNIVATSKHEQGPVREEDDEGKDRDSVKPEMVKKVAEKIKAEYVDELKTYNDRYEDVVQQLKSSGITDPKEIEKEIDDMDDDILSYYYPGDIKGKIELMNSVLNLGPDADGHDIVDMVHNNSGLDTSPAEEIADQFQNELKKADPETFKKLYGNTQTISDVESTQNEGSVPNYLDREWKDNLAACAKGEPGAEDAVIDMLDKFDIPRDKAGDLIQKQIDKKFKGIGVMFKNPLKADPEWDNLQNLVDRLKGKSMGEGNEFAQKVQALKAKGAKPGTKFKTSDGEEHTLEDAIRLAGLQVEDFWTAEELMAEKGADDDTMDVKIDKDGALSKADAPDELHDKEEELPLDEFIKGHFDYTTNQFPKGETAVMTAVEKKYGDEAMRDAMNIMKELVTNQDEEMARIKTLAGLTH